MALSKQDQTQAEETQPLTKAPNWCRMLYTAHM